MSYGSTFVPFEPHGKISARHTRARQDLPERPTRVVHYEKEFDVNLSRLEGPPPSKSSIRDSMLAYSKKMKSIHDARHGSSVGNVSGSSGDKLFVRAKHIPKYPTREPKKRRPMSFDELLGRDREVGDLRPNGAAKQRPKSDKTKPVRDSDKRTETEVRLPLLTERLKKTGPIQVSLVSASDLYEIVDFSLKTKGTKSDSLRLMRMEHETQEFGKVPSNKMADVRAPSSDVYNKYERTTDNFEQDYLRRDTYAFFNDDNESNIPDSAFYEQTFAIDHSEDITPRQERNMNSSLKLPALTFNDPIRRRPNRAKRMRLVDPMLGDIPEDGIFTTGSNPYEIEYQAQRVISPPRKYIYNHNEPIRHSLDSIEEIVESGQSYKSKRPNESVNQEACQPTNQQKKHEFPSTDDEMSGEYRHILDPKSTKKILIRDDGDVRIEVTQCPPKHIPLNAKQKAQKRFKKLIYLRDGTAK